MPASERRARMRAMRSAVMRHDVHRWAEAFSARSAASAGAAAPRPLSSPSETRVESPQRRGARPQAASDARLRRHARAVRADARTRPRRIRSCCNSWTRSRAARACRCTSSAAGRARRSSAGSARTADRAARRARLLVARMRRTSRWRILRRGLAASGREGAPDRRALHVEDARGSLIEEKTGSLAWHYRMAKADFTPSTTSGIPGEGAAAAAQRAAEQHAGRGDHGDKVLEVRPQGVNKGMLVAAAAARRSMTERRSSPSATTRRTRTSSPRCPTARSRSKSVLAPRSPATT